MSLSSINNGDSGASARTKINAAIAALNVTTPKVVYVNAVNGNNATGEIGNPTKPFSTFAAGYAAGRATATSFAMHFAEGDYDYVPNDLEGSFLYCVAIRGAGNNLTNISISAARDDVQNAGGTPGYNIPNLQIDGLTFRATTSGGGVDESDSNSYTCGNGGSINIHGTAKVADINSAGGSEVASTGSTVAGGNGGVVTMTGGLDCRSCSFALSAGTGGAANGTIGEINADNCDLRGVVSVSTPSTIGRCSYTAADFNVTNDKGGNAAY